MLNVAFCDDDIFFLNNTLPLIHLEFEKLKVKAQFKQYQSGKKLIADFKENLLFFDIIFMDIDMPDMNGKQVAEKLRAIDKNFKLIFMTAYEHEALNMFQHDVVGFLPKNKLDIYLSDTLKRAIEKIDMEHPKQQFFQIYSTKGESKIIDFKIKLNDIIYFEVVNREIYMHTIYGEYKLHRYQFSDIVKKYVELGFLDIHRTYLVSSKFINGIGEKSVYLDNGQELILSRRKRKQVLEAFMDDVYREGEN